MSLPIRHSLKKGDRVWYRTPRGRAKLFIFGKQAWYGYDVPNRIDYYQRKGKRGWYKFRLPGILELVCSVLKKRSSELRDSILADNAILHAMNSLDPRCLDE